MKHFQTWLGREIASIPHMFEQADVETLGLLTQGRDTIIEVGCYQGAMTRLFCLFAKQVYSVDWFKGDWAAGEFDEQEVFNAFWLNAGENIETGRLHLCKMDSTEAAKYLASLGVTADFIWIDADHSYESCRADILNYLPLLRPHGVMAGHDVGTFDGVTHAVDELFHGQALYHPNTIWTWQRGRKDLDGCDITFKLEERSALVMDVAG